MKTCSREYPVSVALRLSKTGIFSADNSLIFLSDIVVKKIVY